MHLSTSKAAKRQGHGNSLNPQVRHPCMLTFKDGYEVEENRVPMIYIVTEPVEPLLPALQVLELSGAQK